MGPGVRRRARRRRARPAAVGAGRRRPGRQLAARRDAATRCRAARRRGRSCAPAWSGPPAKREARARGPATAGAARRRATWRGARRHRACRRCRGTAQARGDRRVLRGRPRERCRAPHRHRRRSLAEQRSRLVGLVELSPDDDRVRRWLQCLGHPLGRRERGRRRKPLANERELEQRLGSSVHVRPQRRARARDRRVTGDREPPRPRRPLRAGVGDADPRRDLDRAVVDGIGGVIHVPLEAEPSTPGHTGRDRSRSCRSRMPRPRGRARYRETFDAGRGDAGR